MIDLQKEYKEKYESIDKIDNELRSILIQGDLERLKKFPDVTMNDNYAIRKAASCGQLEMIKYLLTIPGVDVHAKCDQAFRFAAKNSDLETIKFLSTIPNTNFAALDNYAIRYAAFYGRLEVVKFLITLPGVNNDWAIRHAALRDHKKMVEFLDSIDKPKTTLADVSKDELIAALIEKKLNVDDLQKIIKSMK